MQTPIGRVILSLSLGSKTLLALDGVASGLGGRRGRDGNPCRVTALLFPKKCGVSPFEAHALACARALPHFPGDPALRTLQCSPLSRLRVSVLRVRPFYYIRSWIRYLRCRPPAQNGTSAARRFSSQLRRHFSASISLWNSWGSKYSKLTLPPLFFTIPKHSANPARYAALRFSSGR